MWLHAQCGGMWGKGRWETRSSCFDVGRSALDILMSRISVFRFQSSTCSSLNIGHSAPSSPRNRFSGLNCYTFSRFSQAWDTICPTLSVMMAALTEWRRMIMESIGLLALVAALGIAIWMRRVQARAREESERRLPIRDLLWR